MTSHYIALIPAYEPDRKMLGIIADLGKAGMDVIVVDDGSRPEYSEIFEQACEKLPGQTGNRVRLLIHDTNMGKGAALKTGLEYISKNIVSCGYESADGETPAAETVVVTLDADGQHLAKDAVKAAHAAAGSPGTLVLGSRSLDTGVPLRSRFGNTVTRGVFRLVSGVSVHDTQTGLRAFTADMIPMLLDIKGDRYEYEINMLLELAGNGTRIKEIPAETVYIDGNSSSHFDTVKDSCRIYKAIGRYMLRHTPGQLLKFSASSFASFLIDYSMYALLVLTGAGLITANICARMISATANYAINRSLVFRSRNSITRSALQYFGLAAMILAGNTIVLSSLVGAGFGKMAAKVITELLFFTISWIVQRYVIFYKEADTEPAGRSFTLEYKAVRPKRLRDVYSRRRENA